jgi:5-methylcytosine-specific restriction endonuclease McrA
VAVLALDISGIPRKWVSFEDAITYKAKNLVAWTLGDVVAKYNGGYQKDGSRSYLETHSIIAIKGSGYAPGRYPAVSLTNRTLFARDKNICAFCGNHFTGNNILSRDHIMPRSRGGEDTWMNSVTACRPCNQRKGSKTLKEARMELLYLPYVPNHYENLILLNRSILGDQMEYLLSGVPKNSRILQAA